MSFARYRVAGPDGQVIDGRLDVGGRARVLVPQSGSCSVTFPDLDAGTWTG